MLLSYADRSRAIVAERVRHIVVRDNEVVSTYLVDGFVAGTWHVQRERGRMTLVVRPLVRHPKREEHALLDEAEGLVTFLAGDAASRDVVLGLPWASSEATAG
jgi:hypothetical protein